MDIENKLRGTTPAHDSPKEKDIVINESRKPPGSARGISDKKNNLKELHVGDTAQIVDFFDHNDTAKKIEAMGLRKGKRITILKKLGRGILVKTGSTRIVITGDVAKNIEVK
ncbi:MAG: FeoA family protein [Candidatus Kryptoniota bacterium]